MYIVQTVFWCKPIYSKWILRCDYGDSTLPMLSINCWNFDCKGKMKNQKQIFEEAWARDRLLKSAHLVCVYAAVCHSCFTADVYRHFLAWSTKYTMKYSCSIHKTLFPLRIHFFLRLHSHFLPSFCHSFHIFIIIFVCMYFSICKAHDSRRSIKWKIVWKTKRSKAKQNKRKMHCAVDFGDIWSKQNTAQLNTVAIRVTLVENGMICVYCVVCQYTLHSAYIQLSVYIPYKEKRSISNVSIFNFFSVSFRLIFR